MEKNGKSVITVHRKKRKKKEKKAENYQSIKSRETASHKNKRKGWVVKKYRKFL